MKIFEDQKRYLILKFKIQINDYILYAVKSRYPDDDVKRKIDRNSPKRTHKADLLSPVYI